MAQSMRAEALTFEAACQIVAVAWQRRVPDHVRGRIDPSPEPPFAGEGKARPMSASCVFHRTA